MVACAMVLLATCSDTERLRHPLLLVICALLLVVARLLILLLMYAVL
jgi:hypothetical protein